MKQQLVHAILAGMVLPLALAAFFPKGPREGPAETAPPAAAPAVILPVLTPSGQVREMELEAYLVGVVLAEMPADFEEAALQAQAVVARTYTRKRMTGSKHDQAAVCMDPACCQSFCAPADYLEEGGSEDSVDKVRQAVAETGGLVLVYDGQLIDATYFSCSGGSTEDAVAVWGRDVPYLRSVESPGEEIAPRFTDQVRFSSTELAEALDLAPRGDPAGWFRDVTYTQGGGVASMTILGEAFSGTELRSRLNLRSTDFEIAVTGDTIIITTHGFGHRVGMSQYGAQAMALAGADFREILAHYYTDSNLIYTE